jgi:hypothetical protein
MVAEVTVQSIGVGYAVCRALELGMPVLCMHSAGANVSAGTWKSEHAEES